MDTRTFLKAILPSSGIKFVQRIKPREGKKDATILYPVGDYDDAAAKALELDLSFANDNVYYAMASYHEAKFKTVQTKDGKDFTYVVGRTQDNVAAVKSLWFDLDVGKPGSYATQREAAAGIFKYAAATGLPTPVILSSGYGVHCYWVFSEEVSATEWESIAKYQRAAWRHLGILVDPACDQDCARVLRAPGTHNKKAGKEPKAVKVIRGEVNPLPPQEYKRLLRGYTERNNLGAQVAADTPTWAKTSASFFEGVDVEYQQSFAEIAVTHCNQLKDFSTTGGSSEPIWWANVGLLKHFTDGQELAHKWASIHEAYDEGETQSKMDSWTYGPTTCDKFKELEPSLCSGCVHKCRSPIQLGHTDEVTPPNVVELAEKATEAVKAVSAVKPSDDGIPQGWPDKYGYDKAKDTITRSVQDANGVWVPVPIATPLFYPVDQICQEDGTFALRMNVWIRGKVKEFMLPTKFIADERSLKMQLAANRIYVIDQKGVANFMNMHMVDMARRRDEVNTYRQMGWHHDFNAFLIGNTLLTKTETRNVELGQHFPAELRSCYSPKGTAQPWIDAVEELFNRPNGEPYQFAICAAFGSILNPLLGFSEWNGIPYALTSNKSGYGKSTVNKIAMSIWMRQTRDTVVSDSTPKAILGMASAFNNVPFLLDEITSYLKDPKDQLEILYAMSNGAPRKGMRQDGALRVNQPGWCGNFAMTSNRNIMMQLTENKLNPEAGQMRVFEIDLETYPRLATMDEGTDDYRESNSLHAHLARTVMEENYGLIGPDFVRYVMANLEEVSGKLKKVSLGMAKHMEGGDATKERYYYHLITTVLVGGYFAKKLGYINFDLNGLRNWCVQHVRNLRGVAKECQNSPEDQFAGIMADLVGKIIVTKHYTLLDARTGKSEFHVGAPLKNPICGRFVMGDEKERPQLYVTVKAIQQWCVEQGVQFTTMRREFIKHGIVRFGLKDANRDTGAVRVTIGRGVQGIPHLGNPWCLELDAVKVATILQPPAEVTPINKDKAA